MESQQTRHRSKCEEEGCCLPEAQLDGNLQGLNNPKLRGEARTQMPALQSLRPEDKKVRGQLGYSAGLCLNRNKAMAVEHLCVRSSIIA